MKFLCVPCDEAMKLEEVEGPDQGSLAVTFCCPSCLHRISLLTNPLETQLVKVLDVKIGRGGVPQPEPFQFTRSSLAKLRDDAFGDGGLQQPVEASQEAGGCPFGALVREAEEKAGRAEEVRWTEAAEARIQRIPSFVRSWAKKAIERFALERGYRVITEEVLDEARDRIGM
ncbi:MAG: PCP reductase family protein [candidate division NC10 bacterium]|nr:PCP reductase family protein [candidate division NC10 bacterium]